MKTLSKTYKKHDSAEIQRSPGQKPLINQPFQMDQSSWLNHVGCWSSIQSFICGFIERVKEWPAPTYLSLLLWCVCVCGGSLWGVCEGGSVSMLMYGVGVFLLIVCLFVRHRFNNKADMNVLYFQEVGSWLDLCCLAEADFGGRRDVATSSSSSKVLVSSLCHIIDSCIAFCANRYIKLKTFTLMEWWGSQFYHLKEVGSLKLFYIHWIQMKGSTAGLNESNRPAGSQVPHLGVPCANCRCEQTGRIKWCSVFCA